MRGGLHDAPQPYTVCKRCNDRWAAEERRQNEVRRRWLFLLSPFWAVATLPLFLPPTGSLWRYVLPPLAVLIVSVILKVARAWLIERFGGHAYKNDFERELPLPESMSRAIRYTILAGMCIRTLLAFLGSPISAEALLWAYGTTAYYLGVLLMVVAVLYALVLGSARVVSGLADGLGQVPSNSRDSWRNSVNLFRISLRLANVVGILSTVAGILATGSRVIGSGFIAFAFGAASLWGWRRI